MNQNQLIMQVTLFESFMKDIHREILSRNPKLLNPKRQVPIARIFATGLDAVLEEEVEREVISLDRKSIKDRCDYFKNRLLVDWSFDGTVYPLIERSLNMRNEILHGDTDTKVEDSHLQITFAITTGITIVTIVQCHLLYPDAFQPPTHAEGLLTQFRKGMKTQNMQDADDSN